TRSDGVERRGASHGALFLLHGGSPVKRDPAPPEPARRRPRPNATWRGLPRLAGRGRRLGAGLFFEVAEDGPRVDAEVARRLRAVAVVALEDLEHVVALEVFFRLFERLDRLERLGPEIEIFGRKERLVTQDQRLLQAVLELADVARPIEFLD